MNSDTFYNEEILPVLQMRGDPMSPISVRLLKMFTHLAFIVGHKEGVLYSTKELIKVLKK